MPPLATRPDNAHQNRIATHACPQCRRAMRVKLLVPALAGDSDDVTYGCDDCGLELKRSVNRPDAS